MKKAVMIMCIVGLVGIVGAAANAAEDGAALFKSKCAGCHGQLGEKSNADMKELKGLGAEKIKEYLDGYKAGTFGGAKKGIMEKVAQKLTQEQFDALVTHAGSL